MALVTNDELRLLADEAALGRLVARYGEAIDWLDWARIDDLFWADAQFDFGMFKGSLEEYRDFVVALEESYSRRLHMFTLPVIDVAGDKARIDAGSIIVCRTTNDSHGVDDVFYGRYLFPAERRNGTWKLCGLTYVFSLIEQVQRQVSDNGMPMIFAEGLIPAHPLSRHSWLAQN